jgi:short-subunit dehydrogenase
MKTVLITGSSRGLGFALAKQALKNNMKVIAVTRNGTTLHELNNENLIVVECLYTEKNGRDKLVNALQNHKIKLDYLILNAGLLIKNKLENISENDLEKMFQVNSIAPLLLFKELTKNNCLSENYHTVTIGSMGGFQNSVKFPELLGYSASKAAIMAATQCLKEEYSDGRFNSIALGSVETEMFQTAFPQGKAQLTSEKAAQTILNLTLNFHEAGNGQIIPLSLSNP